MARHRKKARLDSMPCGWSVRLCILGALAVAALAGLAFVHARWTVQGPRDPRFVRFLRRHNHRANANDVIPENGVSLDRYGAPLSVAEPGSTFQKVLDELQLASGEPVSLTIDVGLQAKAEAAMKGKSGAVVALEPSTGRIRALVSAPRAAYLNRALDGLYPPGSTFKVFMAAAALSNGLSPVYDCPAAGWRPNRSTPPIRDSEAAEFARRRKTWRGFGRIGMGEALMHSANTYFARLGCELGTERFDTAVAAAKLRDGVTVLPAGTISLSSAAGGVPEGASTSGLAPIAIGQGALHLTPLAVAMFTAAVADDGLMLAPTLSATAKPSLRARPFTMPACARVKKMMREAVRRGTGRTCEIAGLDVCGKTGTAQVGTGADHAWFTCFAPEASPKLVVTVLVEHGGFGAKAAAPVARKILLEARELGYFE